MKLLHLIFRVFTSVFSFSADPNLFGAVKRRKGKEGIAGEFKAMAAGTQAELDVLKTQNPFESAAAKSAMTKASRGAKQMETRMFNTMGAGATPEALIAAQGATSEALGSTAGTIATGAEALKLQKETQLRGLKESQMGMYGNIALSAEEERGSGWNTLFQGISSLGQLASGVGQAGKAFL
ncbi:hypothetical protein KAR91_73320 [Candidatus Pacearchaeota archaeon]|nr:hypothetical protein [Candidatus Pacearchaeota archaeon]